MTHVSADFDCKDRHVDHALQIGDKTRGIIGSRANDWAVIELARDIDRPPLLLGTPFDLVEDDSVVIIQHFSTR